MTVEHYGLVESLRVIYQGGLEVKFGLTSLEWITPPIDAGTAGVMLGAMRILYDPYALLWQAVQAVRQGNAS